MIDFASWLAATRQTLRTGATADVPCDTCTACCRASQFIEVEPDETDTLARIPRELLFPAPGKPGHVVMGYDERGWCPMLVDDRCTIYNARPRACRMYDCRVFAATAVESNAVIAERVQRWEFSYATPAGAAAHELLVATAEQLRATVPNATARALRAIASTPTEPA